MAVIICCENVSKAYVNAHDFNVKELITGSVRHRKFGKFSREWALDDVSFNVNAGEAFGIMGHNGSGKSTLLSLLLGLIRPQKGTIRVEGNVVAMLELGAGFHFDLTGRENIYLYAALSGMKKEQIKERYQKIIDFSELGPAIDSPIRTYSSGMIARLGFSTIIHHTANILLIDEVLAVGDADFQLKCISAIECFKENGGTIVIVSHAMETLKNICQRGICLNEGRVVASGDIKSVIDFYVHKR
jgi:ABC-type polysaccharide/polyol phosphate transport system ATPase subunit